MVYEQCAAALPGALAGHEHFGFKDGVSQPGVRGRLSEAPDDFITPRYPACADRWRRRPAPELYGKPGQQLVWPGQFLLGELRQHTENLLDPAAPAGSADLPAWARRGSYLVCRRLRQDVAGVLGFRRGSRRPRRDDAEHLASMMVGRWPSGAAAHARGHGRRPRPGRRRVREQQLPVRRRHPAAAAAAIPRLPGRQLLAGPRATSSARCARTSRTSARPTRATPPPELGKPHDSMLRMILRRGIAYGEPLSRRRRTPIPTPTAG